MSDGRDVDLDLLMQAMTLHGRIMLEHPELEDRGFVWYTEDPGWDLDVRGIPLPSNPPPGKGGGEA